jgi:hypothetical protein
MAKNIFLTDLVREINEARFYSIMADKVTSHNIKEMALCIRFVDKDRNIREEFLKFCRLKRITGAAIAKAVIKSLQVFVYFDCVRHSGIGTLLKKTDPHLWCHQSKGANQFIFQIFILSCRWSVLY